MTKTGGFPACCDTTRAWDSDSAVYRQANTVGVCADAMPTSRTLARIAGKTEQARRPRIGEKTVNGTADMKAILGCTAFALAIAVTTIPADARGCIKGAIVGGVAGHLAGHHGVLGAAAGCAIGHHEAKRREKALQSPQ